VPHRDYRQAKETTV